MLKECVKWDVHGLSGNNTKSLIDMHSIHIYTADKEHLPNATAPRAAERAIQMTMSLIDLARIENKVPPTVPRQTICFDEWNVWDPVRAPGEQGAEEKYTLSDALAVSVFLNAFIRQAGSMGMANIAQSVNVISPLMTMKDGILKQTTWWPLLLFSKYMRGSAIALNVRSPEYNGRTNPEWIRGTIETPFLDCSASISEDGWVALAVVNLSEEKNYKVRLEVGGGGEVLVYTVAGENVQVKNTEGEQRVGIDESKWNVGKDGEEGMFVFKKHSLTMLRWRV